ncbi:MAG: hypothetical protein EBZ58_10235 [Bacteroidetes bacterium]|nr:hypothetical protein [Bacteroidota bacterium]
MLFKKLFIFLFLININNPSYSSENALNKDSLLQDNLKNNVQLGLTGRQTDEFKFKTKGKIGIVEASYFSGYGSVGIGRYQYANNDASIGIKALYGGFVNENTTIGLGAGVEKYQLVTMFPIFLDVRVNMFNRLISPYLNGFLGESIMLNDRLLTAGYLYGGGIGLKINEISNTFAFNIGFVLKNLEALFNNERTNFIFNGFVFGIAF